MITLEANFLLYIKINLDNQIQTYVRNVYFVVGNHFGENFGLKHALYDTIDTESCGLKNSTKKGKIAPSANTPRQ
jgi:hypothetical protein